ncbi:MAG TPA: hypothetical protein PK311_04680, partial [Syntrophales bacterium]|nr:hypothetical protein [Syntrophales bacterium]
MTSFFPRCPFFLTPALPLFAVIGRRISARPTAATSSPRQEANMKVILKEDVETLGKRGDT